MADFPNQVNAMNAPAVEGDFASANPRAVVLAGEGALVSGDGVVDGVAAPGVLAGGIIVGRFGWLAYTGVDSDEAPAVVNTFGSGLPAGLVHRIQIGLITQYLAPASLVLLKGQQTTLFNNVDMWIKNRGGIYAQVGMKAFARFSDGAMIPNTAGATPPGGSGSASTVAAGTFTATGSITNNILTATAAAGTNGIVAGGTISGTGVATGTKIVGQIFPLLAGEAIAGIGRYTVSIPEQTVASTAISGTYGILTVGGTVVAGFGPGQIITGTGISVPTTIGQQLSGTAGAAGTYVVDVNTVVGSTAITSQASVETKWIIKSGGAAGELVKLSPVV